MKNDIFKDAKFDDKFYTMDGRILIYHCAKPIFYGTEMMAVNQLIEEFNSDFILCNDAGKCLNMLQYGNDYDVVDRYVEKIDEERLDKLAEEEVSKTEVIPNDWKSYRCLKKALRPDIATQKKNRI